MLSNGSKPTSYGAASGSINSANQFGKSAISGLLDRNDNVWQCNRSNAPIGVRSDTSSNHNVSNNIPY